MTSVQRLDLELVKGRLCRRLGWSREKVEAIECAYRAFLVKALAGEQVSPTRDVDDFWHMHILDTQKYAMDCQMVFGFFLHHIPNNSHTCDFNSPPKPPPEKPKVALRDCEVDQPEPKPKPEEPEGCGLQPGEGCTSPIPGGVGSYSTFNKNVLT